MDNWDEIRTAFQVARVGTVSGAADQLGVHHATVIRHIDALEQRLGAKLFQRHARGYTPTEAGQDLLQVAGATDDQFTQLAGRIRGQGEGVSGELVVTSLVFLAPMIAPVMARFQHAHPDVILRFLTGDRLFRLEYGEAHVALRAGPAPDQPDNVVQPFGRLSIHLVAAPSYIERFGTPQSEEDLKDHRFVSLDDQKTRAPFQRWLLDRVPQSRVSFRASDGRAIVHGVKAGAGIGFVTSSDMDQHTELVEVLPSEDDWSVPLWLVTHMDLHRTTKVQAFLKFLKDDAPNWSR